MRRLAIPFALFVVSLAALSASACSSIDDCEKTVSCPYVRDGGSVDASRDAADAGGRLDAVSDATGSD